MSHFLVHLFQDLLSERFPKFAYWLFYSEMTAAIIIGLTAVFLAPEGTIFGSIFLLYAAFNWVGACNYGRKRALHTKALWQPSRVDRGVAICFNAGIGIGGGFLLYILRDNWLIVAAGIMLIGIAIFNLVKLCSGGWIEFP